MSQNTSGDKAKTSFLDLPPEMRNQVYRYCLVLPGKISKLQAGSYNIPIHAEEPWTPQLLQASSQIAAEAITILYGENNFAFYRKAEAKAFFDRVADNAKFIRSFEISIAHPTYVGKTNLRGILTLVKQATGLKTLTVRLHHHDPGLPFIVMQGGNGTAEMTVAQVLGPIMRKYRRAHRNQSDEDVMKLLCWEVEEGWAPGTEEARRLRKLDGARKGAVFGAKVEELLLETFK